MIQFSLRPSRVYKRWTIGIFLIVTIGVLASTSQHRVALLLLTTIISVWYFFKHQRAHQAVIGYSDNEWWLVLNGAEPIAVEWLPGSVVIPSFFALKWRAKSEPKKGLLLVWHDALDEADYRHLCRLYWHHKPNDD